MKQAIHHINKGLVNIITSVYTLPAYFLSFIWNSIKSESSRSKDTLKEGLNSKVALVKIATFATIFLISIFTSVSLVQIGNIINYEVTSLSNKEIVTAKAPPRQQNYIGNESYMTSFTVDGFLAVGEVLFGVAQGVADKILVKSPDFTGVTDVRVNWGVEMDSNFSGMYKLSVTGANILLSVFFLTKVLEEVIKLSNGRRYDFIAPLFQLFMIQLAFIIMPILTSSFINLFNDMNEIILGKSPLFEYQSKIFSQIKEYYKPKDEGWAKNLLKAGSEAVSGILFSQAAGNFGVGVVVGLTVLLTQLITLGFIVLISITKIQMIFLYIIMPILVALSLFDYTKEVYKSAITSFTRLLLLPLFYIIAFRIINLFMVKLTTQINLETMFLYLGACGFLFTVNLMSASLFGDYSAYGQEQATWTINKGAYNLAKAGLTVAAGAISGVAGAGAGGATAAGATSATSGSTMGASTLGSSELAMTGNKTMTNYQGAESSIPKLEGKQAPQSNSRYHWSGYSSSASSSSSSSTPPSSSIGRSSNIIEDDWQPIPLKKINRENSQLAKDSVNKALNTLKN